VGAGGAAAPVPPPPPPPPPPAPHAANVQPGPAPQVPPVPPPVVPAPHANGGGANAAPPASGRKNAPAKRVSIAITIRASLVLVIATDGSRAVTHSILCPHTGRGHERHPFRKPH
jgi:hypothetical protein